MDPNANRNEQKRLADAITRCEIEGCANCLRHGRRLAELVVALHEWIERGGPLPSAWRPVNG
jgi:hypothetical protein